MSSPKLVIGYGGGESTRSKIGALLRNHCHVDTILDDLVLARYVDRLNPWKTLPTDCDIILHPSLSKGLRKNISRSKKPGYEVIIDCSDHQHFERCLVSRLKVLSLHWTNSAVRLLSYWKYDVDTDVNKVQLWANQFRSHLGGAILRCLKIIRANQILPSIGIKDVDCFDYIVAITDENGDFTGSESHIKELLEGKKISLKKIEELVELPTAPSRVMIVVDWLLSGRQFLSYMSRSRNQFKILSDNGTRFCLKAARITELAKARLECALNMLEINHFKVYEPYEGFLPNLRTPLSETLAKETLLPTDEIKSGQIVSEFEMRLLQAGYSGNLTKRWISECEKIGHQLVYPEPKARGKMTAECWGLGNDGLGLTTLTYGTVPASLLPVLWCGGCVCLQDGGFENWKPLITRG